MSTIPVKNGNLDSAFRVLKQTGAKDGLLKKVRERSEGYLKPGEKRRKKRKEGIKNSRRREKNY